MTQATSFFARRRAGIAAEREAAVAPAPVPEAEPLSDDETLDLLELPDPDTLKAGDDFAAFMSKAVPTHLRNRALRKLWRSDPVLACLDGLNDYDDDYLKQATGQGVIKTSYQVGKGMLAHLQEVARQQEAAEATQAVAAQEEEPAAAPEVQTSVAPVASTDPDVAPTATDRQVKDQPAAIGVHVTPAVSDETIQDRIDDIADDRPALPPRRMRFAFEGDTA